MTFRSYALMSDNVDVYSAAEGQLVSHFKAEEGVAILRATVAIEKKADTWLSQPCMQRRQLIPRYMCSARPLRLCERSNHQNACFMSHQME
eukprot:2880-Heterococcus_DN1.PRE.1